MDEQGEGGFGTGIGVVAGGEVLGRLLEDVVEDNSRSRPHRSRNHALGMVTGDAVTLHIEHHLGHIGIGVGDEVLAAVIYQINGYGVQIERFQQQLGRFFEQIGGVEAGEAVGN